MMVPKDKPSDPDVRRLVLPLPVGFFKRIVTKNIASQEVDYLPQVPNLPQTRSVGRVKPRSLAKDWINIGFDPWSAGKKPLNSDRVESLMEKLEEFFPASGANAIDDIQELQRGVIKGDLVELQDAEGHAAAKKMVLLEQQLLEDFKRICSLFRHGKVEDCYALMSQPDWNLPIDYQDDYGNTLMHVAAQNGNKRLLKVCLKRGCNINIANLRGQTALHFAYGYGFNAAGEYLISKGADDSIKNKDGLSCYEGLGIDELKLL